MRIRSSSARGIHAREVVGIEAFQKRLPNDWYGYANLELVQRTERPRQIDVALVIEDRILIADLKDWRGTIRSDGRSWYQNDRIEESSPVKKIDDNARVITGELNSFLRMQSLKSGTNEKITLPYIQGCVILTNKCKIDLAEGEERFVFFLEDFCRALANTDKRERYRLLGDPIRIDKQNSLIEKGGVWRNRLDNFFGAKERFQPQQILYADHRVSSDVTFKRADGLYEEYDVEEISGSNASGLLRIWDFHKAPARYLAEEARAEVAGREQSILSFLVERAPELESVLLRAKARDTENGVRYWEIFERRRQLRRLRDFIRANEEQLSPTLREDIVRALISHVATMHRLGAAHVDLGAHSIWLELPCSVRISHLLAAHYPAVHTLGQERFTFLANDTVLPEALLGTTTTLFQKDVFLLGVSAHEILLGSAPRRNSEDDAPHWDEAADTAGIFRPLHGWLDKALSVDPAHRFADGQMMLDAFNEATQSKSTSSVAYERLARFRRWKSLPSLFREYPEAEVFRDDALSTTYRSDKGETSYLVKYWSASHLGDVRSEAARLLAFLERAEDLSSRKITGVCLPLAAGLAGDSVALVQEFRRTLNLEEDLRGKHPTWDASAPTLSFVLALCSAVQALHEIGHTHGDISPANVLVIRDEEGIPSPWLVDVLDLPAAGDGELRTPAYTPPFAADATERDRFGVLRICEDLLRGELLSSQDAERISAAIATCREGPPRLASLEPLVDAVRLALVPPEESAGLRLSLVLPRSTTGLLLPDDGIFRVVPDTGPARRLQRLLVCGACEELVIEIDADSVIRSAFTRPLSQSEAMWRERKAIASFAGSVAIAVGTRDFSGLLPLLDLQEVVEWRAGSAATVASSPGPQAGEDYSAGTTDASSPERDGFILEEDNEGVVDVSAASLASEDVALLWRTFLKVESEQFNRALAEEDSQFLRRQRRHVLRYVMTAGILEYEPDERVLVEILTRSGSWKRIGLLDVQRTSAEALAIDSSSLKMQDDGMLVRAGSELRFVGVRDAESRARRQSATDVILDGRAGISNLVDYFASDALPPSEREGDLPRVLVPVSPLELTTKYGLNHAQADALTHLWMSRPLGLLQGPPGTGKTMFIAALVHLALTVGGLRNVLLASQSHEAVNNVAEEVLKVFRRLGQDPSLVRVGHEGQVSERLKPFHSAKVEARYREQFRAKLKDKLRLVGRQIAATSDFIDDLFFLEATLRPILWRIAEDVAKDSEMNAEPVASEMIEGLRDTALRLLAERGLPLPPREGLSDPDALEKIVLRLAEETGGATRDQAKRLLDLAELSRDWLNSVSSRNRNFESFLVGTRQIVAGTCVGLGRSSFAPASGSFDLVIVDEAARCAASELAVPMQAGRWVVLVGDHAQLEPQYEPSLLSEVTKRTNVDAAILRRSDFERAFGSPYGLNVGRTLRTQYRMLPAIGKLVSEAYYRGSLEHGRTLPDLNPECFPPGMEKALIWVDTSGLGRSAYQRAGGRGERSLLNDTEATLIVDLLVQLDAHEPFKQWLAAEPADTQPIGIICMYAAQRDHVRRRLAMTQLSDTMRRACKVETVDSYQGKQNAIVFLSLVRNNDAGRVEGGGEAISEGFLAKPNRLNVAMSRARDRLVVFGSLNRWPEDGAMARISALVRGLADDGEAAVVNKF